MEPLNIILILLAIVAWRAAVHFHKKKVQWSSAKAGLASLVAIASIGVNLLLIFGIWKFKDAYTDSVDQESRESYSQGFVLGQRLAAACPGKTTLIIHPPLPADPGTSAQARYQIRMHEELLKGLRQGAGKALSFDNVAVLPAATEEEMKRLLVPPNLQDNDDLQDLPQMKLTPEETKDLRCNNSFSFDRTLAKHQDAQLVISLEALPPHFENMSYWENKHKQSLVVCNANQLAVMKYLVDAKRITAAVAQNPKFTSSNAAGNTSEAEVFQNKYIIIDGASSKQLDNELGPLLKIKNPKILEKLDKIFIETVD